MFREVCTMTKRTHRLLLFLSSLCIGCAHGAREAPAEPSARAAKVHASPRAALRVALTIDDLPGNEIPTAAWPKSRIMGELIAILRARAVPAPVGFANGIYAAGDADAARALRSWSEAGFELGNHTYSHLSANELDVEAFLADVARNEALLAALQGATPQRYFRFPYLERGGTAERRAALRRGLHAQGYRIADVSIDFADWAFTGAHARCTAAGDQAALAALSDAYVEHALAALYWAHESALSLFGRAIPQVLLLHAIVPTARNLEALLAAYEQAGVELIPLREALEDPAYSEEPELDHADTNAISEAIRRQGAALRGFVPRAQGLLELVCRGAGG
jgi:peptidoglycan/xylan/chitin deacetylase (PgdA/CDA1 family)